MKKTRAKSIKNFFDEIKISPERQAELDKMFEEHKKWHDAHPDYNERYGTDKSYWLEKIREAGFNPVGITTMTCEETIIMETEEEAKAAWEIFKPEGWWYCLDQWKETRDWYVNSMYEGKDEEAPIVYCMRKEHEEIIKHRNPGYEQGN